ncbi:transglutaminase family protein [Jatrophihabitans telluris]|uniref:Transglutaminase family protein n=1 Tax=Jatrophihabitans telluris TaxID=2038343 RepID=A0ABY4QVK7_9ACTN|nr:transglutaminase family protein [Jatrophihabitans telluris]UQX87473.1 transglutaminase family protein [Jatrophihabitans telluris]
MSRTYHLVHTTRYEYEAPVERSYGRAHLLPSDSDRQRVLDRELEISPVPSDTNDHLDYFGNISTFYLVRRPHTTLTVTARSRLLVDRPRPDVAQLDTLTWEDVRDSLAESPAIAEYRLASPRARASTEVTTYARSIFTPSRPFGSALVELTRRIHSDFSYETGATTVYTTPAQLLRKRAGVCQDFTHLAVAALRSVGLAGRYVSGYLETQPPAGQAKLQGADASHAWPAAYAPGHGWVDFDPTNDQWVDERYLVVATGRDYGDVPPLKGIIVTDSKKSTMQVSVDVNPV